MTAEQLRMAIFKDVLTGKLTQSKDVKELKSIDDEYFDIYQVPATWDIVSLQDSCYIHARIGWQALRKDEHQKSGEYLLVTGTDFKDGLVDYSTCVYVSKERYEMDEKIQIQNDDILVTKDGSIGKVAVVKELPMPATLNAGVFVIRPDNRFDKRYIEYLFQGSYFTHFVNLVKSGTTIKHLNQNKLLKFKIPVPSKDEQQEIVHALDKLLPYVDKFEQLDKRVQVINSKFPEEMKKSILQYAIQGKLVEQRTEEGNAEELYQQIQEEKQKLIKAGKIKKEKTLADITEDEMPFDIPENWKWVRIGNIASVQSSKRVFEKDYVSDGIPFFRSKEIGDLYRGEEIKTELFITEAHYDQLKKDYGVPQKGDILITSVGTIGNTWICDDREFYYKDGNITQIVSNKFFCSEYLEIFLHSPLFERQVFSTVAGTAYSALTIIKLKNLMLPFPPLEEQHRIVAKINELLPYCNRLAN